jgi:hypothetical protein
MKRLVVLVAATALLATQSAPSAESAATGCWATVGLSSLPKPGHRAGQPWVVTVRVLQHGRTPLADAEPELRIRKGTGRVTAFAARATATVGSYRARVVFPSAGRWSFSVYDGFVPHCASVHTFRAVTIAPAQVEP